MKNARLLANNMCKEYSIRINGSKFPSLKNLIIHERREEAYKISYQGGCLSAESENPMAAVYAVSQIQAAVQSGHLADIIGQHQSRFSLRPLWILGESPFKEISKQHLVCRRILELGYNAIFLNPSIQPELISLLHDYGIKIILKPNKIEKSFLQEDYQQQMKKMLNDQLNQGIDYIFWESNLYSQEIERDPTSREMTEADLVEFEMKQLEALLEGECKLIYYVPTPNLQAAQKQAKWMARVCDEAREGTIISFSVVAGSPDEDHLPFHPFWEILRHSPDSSATPLLPILNAGCIHQGEGLWPVLALDLIDRTFAQMEHHHFAGTAVLTRTIPGKSGFLDCNLWVTGRMLWDPKPALLYAETWFQAFRPELDLKKIEFIQMARRISTDLSLFRAILKGNYVETPEESRSRAESSLGQLNYLIALSIKEKGDQANKPFLADYMRYFERDARRIIMHSLQSLNLSLPNLMSGVDAHESFWTKLLETPGSGIRGAAKVALLDHPNPGSQDLKMPMIYQESLI